MSSSLPRFLRLARDTVFKTPIGRPLTIVLGNTSADLDSFISAVVFAYFLTKDSSNTGNDSRIYIPLLNLTDVPSSDLWRLRPEYGTALFSAVHESSNEARKEIEKTLLQDLITIADIRADPTTSLHAIFTADTDSQDVACKQNTILVDHNAPSVTGLDSIDLSTRLNLIGVIDHHLDEENVPSSVNPRIIQTGIGSCTSLVVQHLRDTPLWVPASTSTSTSTSTSPSQASAPASTSNVDTGKETDAQGNATLAVLALAPILIDTNNLTSTGDRISPVDHSSVSFLLSHIALVRPSFDRKAFFDSIQHSKSNKLQLLSIPEILDSDYKSWTEAPSSTQSPLNIGITSLVQPLSWLISHAGSASKLTEAINFYVKHPDHNLSLLALITKGNSPDGSFQKELAILAYGETAIKALHIFEADAVDLDLQPWKEDSTFLEALARPALSDGQGPDARTACRVWWQGNVSKTRKQIAPLLRDAVEKA